MDEFGFASDIQKTLKTSLKVSIDALKQSTTGIAQPVSSGRPATRSGLSTIRLGIDRTFAQDGGPRRVPGIAGETVAFAAPFMKRPLASEATNTYIESRRAYVGRGGTSECPWLSMGLPGDAARTERCSERA